HSLRVHRQPRQREDTGAQFPDYARSGLSHPGSNFCPFPKELDFRNAIGEPPNCKGIARQTIMSLPGPQRSWTLSKHWQRSSLTPLLSLAPKTTRECGDGRREAATTHRVSAPASARLATATPRARETS